MYQGEIQGAAKMSAVLYMI